MRVSSIFTAILASAAFAVQIPEDNTWCNTKAGWSRSTCMNNFYTRGDYECLKLKPNFEVDFASAESTFKDGHIPIRQMTKSEWEGNCLGF